MNNDEFYNGYVTGETDAKNGAEPMVFDCKTGDFMAGYEMAYYNIKTKEKDNEGGTCNDESKP